MRLLETSLPDPNGSGRRLDSLAQAHRQRDRCLPLPLLWAVASRPYRQPNTRGSTGKERIEQKSANR